MTFQEGLKLQGSPAIIPDCGRDSLPEFFKEMGYKIGVEVGAHKGEYTELFCKAGLKIYAIDPWIGSLVKDVPKKNSMFRMAITNRLKRP